MGGQSGPNAKSRNLGHDDANCLALEKNKLDHKSLLNSKPQGLTKNTSANPV